MNLLLDFCCLSLPLKERARQALLPDGLLLPVGFHFRLHLAAPHFSKQHPDTAVRRMCWKIGNWNFWRKALVGRGRTGSTAGAFQFSKFQAQGGLDLCDFLELAVFVQAQCFTVSLSDRCVGRALLASSFIHDRLHQLLLAQRRIGHKLGHRFRCELRLRC